MSHRFLLTFCLALIGALLPNCNIASGEHAESRVTLIVDVSNSMQGPKLQAAKEGAKLAVAMLDEETTVQIVAFNHEAKSSPRFSLKNADEREQAWRWIDGLQASGNTDYLKALRATPLDRGGSLIFLSDGEPSNPSDDVLRFVKSNCPAKLHTIAVGCERESNAAKLLSQMATATKGSFTRVDGSEELVRTLVKITARVGKYYRHTPKEQEVPLGIVAPGTLIGIGYDGVPELVISVPANVTRFRAELPGEKVNLVLCQLKEPLDVLLKLTDKKGAKGRLGDVHLVGGGLPEARWTLDTNSAGQVPTGGPLQVTVEFLDRTGSRLDLHVHNHLGAEVELRTPDGKILETATAKPGADEHQLKATVKVPVQEGALSLHGHAKVTTPQGAVFTSDTEQAIVATKPVNLTSKPERLELTTKVGAFSATLAIGVEISNQAVMGITAELPADVMGLRLVEASSQEGRVELHFEATEVGIHRGSLVIRANSELLAEPLSVPFRFVVEPKSKGLQLAKLKEISFGKVAANAGNVLTSVELLSLDDEPFEYAIDVTDLSGPNGTIEVRSDSQSVSPTSRAPSALKLTASVMNAVAGEYRGRLVIRDKAPELGREWKLDLILNVTEPLSAAPVEIGAVGVGQAVTRNFRLANRSPNAIKDISLVPPKQWSGSKQMTDDIELTVAEEPIELAGKAERNLKLRVVVSPLTQFRGPVTGHVLVRRGDVDAVSIPIRLNVVEEAKGPVTLTVSPLTLALTTSSGDVAEFALKCRLAEDADADDTLTVQFEKVTGPDGQPAELSSDFAWKDSAKIARSANASGKGFVIAPKAAGKYTAEVRVSSQFGGSVVVPLSLTVR